MPLPDYPKSTFLRFSTAPVTGRGKTILRAAERRLGSFLNEERRQQDAQKAREPALAKASAGQAQGPSERSPGASPVHEGALRPRAPLTVLFQHRAKARPSPSDTGGACEHLQLRLF